MSSVSGLNLTQRKAARNATVHAAMVALHHAPAIHYTQGPSRWSGIDHHRVAALGQFPTEADCSAMVTWELWNGLYLLFGKHDIVNGDSWHGGFTGTMAQHGRRVHHLRNVFRGDAVLYGAGPNYDHTALIVGHKQINGKRIPMVVSHGSEIGPLLLEYNYRSDIGQIRRYI